MMPPLSIRCISPANEFSAVLHIERTSFAKPWSPDVFRKVIRAQNTLLKVAVNKERERVVGFVAYGSVKTHVIVLNVAVAPAFRRLGIGSALMEHPKRRLSASRRVMIEALVDGSNLGAQLFFRDLGFLASHVIYDGHLAEHAFSENENERYLMRYWLDDGRVQYSCLANRVGKYLTRTVR